MRLGIDWWSKSRYSMSVLLLDSYRPSRLRIVYAHVDRSATDVILRRGFQGFSGVTRCPLTPVNVLPPAAAETPHFKQFEEPSSLVGQHETTIYSTIR